MGRVEDEAGKRTREGNQSQRRFHLSWLGVSGAREGMGLGNRTSRVGDLVVF